MNQPSSDNPVDLSIVVPALDEAERIGRALEAIRAFAAKADYPCELIVVDDGSEDETPDIVNRFEPGPLRLRLIRNETNRGKGCAVRLGVLASAGRFVLMCDADLSAPIDEFHQLRAWLDRGYDVAIGSRDMPGSHLDPPQPPLRRWLAWGFRTVRRRLLLPNLRDTQCGFKCFRGDVARDIFRRAVHDGWLFDCEILGIADRLGYRIREVGILWRSDPDSRVDVADELLTALPALLAIRRRLRKIRGDGAIGNEHSTD